MAKMTPLLVREIQRKPVKEINYQFDKTISYSQFSIYSKCPHRWSLEYRDGKGIYQASMAAVFGTAIHRTMQHYIQTMFDESGAAADRIDIETYFQNVFSEEYKNIISGGEAIAIVSGITYFGFVFGPPMMGAISDQIGLRWAMMIPAGLAIILALGARKVLTSSS